MTGHNPAASQRRRGSSPPDSDPATYSTDSTQTDEKESAEWTLAQGRFHRRALGWQQALSGERLRRLFFRRRQLSLTTLSKMQVVKLSRRLSLGFGHAAAACMIPDVHLHQPHINGASESDAPAPKIPHRAELEEGSESAAANNNNHNKPVAAPPKHHEHAMEVEEDEVERALEFVVEQVLDRERAGLDTGHKQKIAPPAAQPEPGQRIFHQYGVLPDELALSCSGCGFLGTYHFGVMICFQRHAKGLLSRVTRFAGASAGSLVACLMVYAPEHLTDGLHEMYRMADELNSLKLGALTPGFYLNERLQRIIERFMPAQLPRHAPRLTVSLTRQRDRANVLKDDFPDRATLIQALLASCYIPVYSMGYYANPPNIQGDAFIDGGYTNNLPVFSDLPTITVSPFSGSAMIAPSDRNMFEWRMTLGSQQMKVNMQNIVRGAQALFPPASNVLHAYYEMGFRDGLKFLLHNGLLERQDGTQV